MLQAIVFDFDGVLVDSEPLHYQAFAMVGKSLGVSFTWDQYLAQYIGFDDRDAFRLMLAVNGEEATEKRITELCAAKQAAFLAITQAGATGGSLALPGSVELLDECVAAKLPVAIASGATTADIHLMLDLIDRRHCFPVIVSADDVEHSKPHPASYALAAQRLGVEPRHCLAIEDTAAGLASAAAAGLQTLALTTTGHPDVLKQAQRIVENLRGVGLDQLRQWY